MNIITERHEIGITMNLGKYPVIGLDMDNNRKHDPHVGWHDPRADDPEHVR